MVCIRRDSRDSESAEAFLRRLTERRVIRFLGATPMGDELPLVSPSAVAWWESVDQFTRRESDPTDVLSLVDADEIRDDVKLLLILNRLESANYSIVVTSSDRIDPSDQRFLLSERYVTTWSFEHALGKI